MENKYETRIKKVFEDVIPMFVNEDGKVRIEDIAELEEFIDARLRYLYVTKKIKNEIQFFCGFFKWNEEDETTISDEQVDTWEEAEDVKISLHLTKDSNRKNKSEEKLLEECLTMVKNVLDTSLFMDIDVNIWMDEHENTNNEMEYTYMSSLCLTKTNFNTNHPTHAYQGRID